ncbi:hypothetical protein MENTO_v1c04480 [Mesoplasma entomophilum]|uniref:Viral histone-like protein n=1 Tax=Mesoplasma entomophilum TaxID=2149 RepID=A0A3S5XZW0_9MOLU|nr:HU family DNA-binding protein [Mesoplasma entomophilum]ATQ35586.1 hypothetical protein CS528_02325 [Mesoplasma entomophilum]ATZ19553.1 hypothetical protein MENTO_v1c04480 [Mesoplasma entomophilum]
MKIIKSYKFKLSIIILLMILSTTLMIIFKLLNNFYYGNEQWSQAISDVFGSHVFKNWFKNTSGFMLGPIGLYSMVQSNLYSGSTFLTPVFLDALINWIYLFAILGLIILLILNLIFKNKIIESAPNYSHEKVEVQENKNSQLIIKEKVTREDKLVKKTSYDKVSKKYLIDRLAEMYPDYKKRTINEIVNNLVQNIENHLINGEEVLIENFGKLVKIEKPVKQAINPSNGESVEVPASTIIKFKPSRNLKLIMSDTKWTGIKYNKKTIETITIEEEQK